MSSADPIAAIATPKPIEGNQPSKCCADKICGCDGMSLHPNKDMLPAHRPLII